MALYLPANMTLVGNELFRSKHSRLLYRSVYGEEEKFYPVGTSSLEVVSSTEA
jgi:hypothetical protein